MSKAFEDLRSFIAARVREGFDSVHEIVEHATRYAEENLGRQDLAREIRRLTAELLAEHETEQSDWPSPADCDRLNEAFATLNDQGIVARQDFSCCNNCGFGEIWAEVEKEERLRPVEGYVFYHLQATRRAVETGRLLIAYGSLGERLEDMQRVASQVVAELRRVGLDASWEGTERHPIVVSGIVWRRRREHRPPATH
jgi:hypothetical protein